jgi:hypothetical protein
MSEGPKKMIRKRLDLPLKGGRDYLHGTDMFQHVRAVLMRPSDAPLLNFEIAFHRLATRPLELEVGGKIIPKNAATTGSYHGEAGKVLFCLLETDGVITCHRPHPEEDIINCAQFSEKTATATLQEDMTFTDIEIWVAMIKELHMRLFPDVTGKWLFARAKMSEYSPHHTSTSYGVAFASRFGHKLTRSEITLDGRKVGDIFFALM